jgi:lipopolysaccharide assembly outer membrane protein LptD (OstA)
LTDVSATIELTNSNNIKIISDYGKYNSDNFDTIFSKNVIINYLDNKINGEYLDFSIARGNMIISRNVVYSNPENILEADIIDINIETKDTKISMFDKNEKVNLRSKQ